MQISARAASATSKIEQIRPGRASRMLRRATRRLTGGGGQWKHGPNSPCGPSRIPAGRHVRIPSSTEPGNWLRFQIIAVQRTISPLARAALPAWAGITAPRRCLPPSAAMAAPPCARSGYLGSGPNRKAGVVPCRPPTTSRPDQARRSCASSTTRSWLSSALFARYWQP